MLVSVYSMALLGFLFFVSMLSWSTAFVATTVRRSPFAIGSSHLNMGRKTEFVKKWSGYNALNGLLGGKAQKGTEILITLLYTRGPLFCPEPTSFHDFSIPILFSSLHFILFLIFLGIVVAYIHLLVRRWL